MQTPKFDVVLICEPVVGDRQPLLGDELRIHGRVVDGHIVHIGHQLWPVWRYNPRLLIEITEHPVGCFAPVDRPAVLRHVHLYVDAWYVAMSRLVGRPSHQQSARQTAAERRCDTQRRQLLYVVPIFIVGFRLPEERHQLRSMRSTAHANAHVVGKIVASDLPLTTAHVVVKILVVFFVFVPRPIFRSPTFLLNVNARPTLLLRVHVSHWADQQSSSVAWLADVAWEHGNVQCNSWLDVCES